MAKSKKTRQTNPLPTEARPRFEALVSRRVTMALAAIENVGKIARSKPIEYTEDDILAIGQALTDAISEATDALQAGLRKASERTVRQVFTLPKATGEGDG